jgi:hypothetical protein
MKFYKLIKDILNTLRMEKAEFQRLTGINPVNITWWEQHPDTLPQMKTIKRIEQGLGIVFEFDEDGRTTGWQRSDGASASDNGSMMGTIGKDKVLGGGTSSTVAQNALASVSVPASASELYAQFDTFSDNKDWEGLSVTEMKFYENLHQVFLLEVEQANANYERTMDQAAITRAHSIEDAKQKIRRTILNNLMGNMKFSSELPI